MRKILILGATGMLGHAVADLLRNRGNVELLQSSRIKLPGYLNFDADSDNISDLLNVTKPDWVVNCIGVIKPHINEQSSKSIMRAVQINSIFPQILSNSTKRPIIQIATDCVFSGDKGNYIESDLHDATDVYGKTKSLGEVPSENMKHLRVSIIGPENGRATSLLEWFRNQPKNSEIKGFVDHLWNGVSTYQFGRIVLGLIENEFTDFTKTHIVPADVVTKAELLNIFSWAYNRGDLKILEINSSKTINRTLDTSNSELNSKIWRMAGYEIAPSIKAMVVEQAQKI
jgi:dTDP-4-dehydrorhamnose reductase